MCVEEYWIDIQPPVAALGTNLFQSRILGRSGLSRFSLQETSMATNKPTGDNARIGAVRQRSQLETSIQGERAWTKRSKETGQFMDQKAGGENFKGVRKEK